MYQGARTVYCRYKNTKGVELVYDLSTKPLLFLDSGLVFPGLILWEDRLSGAAHPLHAGPEYYGERRLAREDVIGLPFRAPHGVNFVAEPAQRGPDLALDDVRSHLMGGTLLHDGLYRLWYTTREPQQSLAAQATSSAAGYDLGHLGNVLCYAESTDGVHWQPRRQDHVLVNGTSSNIVYGSVVEPALGFGGGSLFVDPVAPASERYKLLFTGRMSPRQQLVLARQLGKTPDPMSLMTGIPPALASARGAEFAQAFVALATGRIPDEPNTLPDVGGQVVFGAVSPDGFHWRTLPQPVMWFMTEFQNAFYDSEKAAYVTYSRLWHVGQRRTIGKAETQDFSDWPLPRPVLMPGLQEPLSVDYYTNAHSLYPGRSDVHLFFVTKYRRGADDCSDIHLAISLDGDLFEFVPGGPVITQEPWLWGPDAVPGAGFIIPLTGLVPFGQNHVGLVYGGSNVAHKWPRTTQLQHFARWALWEKERMVALAAPAAGEFVTAGLILHGRHIALNAKTALSGHIRAELLDANGQPAPGFGLADADPIVGDYAQHVLTWRGQSDLGAYRGQKVFLRFHLSNAKLYSLWAAES